MGNHMEPWRNIFFHVHGGNYEVLVAQCDNQKFLHLIYLIHNFRFFEIWEIDLKVTYLKEMVEM